MSDRQTFIDNLSPGDEVEWKVPNCPVKSVVTCKVFFIRDCCGIDPRTEDTVVELVACSFPKNEDWYAEVRMEELS